MHSLRGNGINSGVLRFLFVLSSILLFAVPALQARIGESRATIERRLTSAGGIIYRDDAIESARIKGKPYAAFFELIPASADLRIYFKTADGRKPTSSELNARGMGAGWDLHVLYVEGESVMEFYERSTSMSDFEFNRLLAVHAEGSYWERLKRDDERELSAFGYEMRRADGAVRARRTGRTAMLFVDAAFDSDLAEMKDADLQQKAPISIEGF